MQRSDRAARAETAIEIVRNPQRVGVRHDDRVQRRAGLVVRIDAREILFDERSAGERSVAERGLDVGDGGFVESKGARRLRRDGCDRRENAEATKETGEHRATE